MFHITLFSPQIPPNTGNIIRLCSNTGSSLYLIKPLGFSLDQKSMRRAGLDYLKNVRIKNFETSMIFCIILVLIGFILLQNLVRNDTINLNIILEIALSLVQN